MQHGGGDTAAGSGAQLHFPNCYETIHEPISLANYRAIYTLGTNHACYISYYTYGVLTCLHIVIARQLGNCHTKFHGHDLMA